MKALSETEMFSCTVVLALLSNETAAVTSPVISSIVNRPGGAAASIP